MKCPSAETAKAKGANLKEVSGAEIEDSENRLTISV